MPVEMSPASGAGDDLTSRVLRIIAETQRKDPSQVTIDSSFEELGIDSINVPDDEVKNIRSVRDMVEGVRRLVGHADSTGDTAPAAS